MKARRLWNIILVAVLALAAAWWLLRDTFQTFKKTTEPAQAIRFAHCGDQEDHEFWKTTIHDFEKAHPGARVLQEYAAGAGEQYALKLNQEVHSQTLPDVLLLPLTSFHELSESLDVVDKPLADLDPIGLKAYEIHSAQRGLPFSGGNLLIFLNKKAFRKASEFHAKPVELPGDDWTVAQFLRTAEMLTCDFDRDGVTDQFGFWLPRWAYYLPFIWSFGAELTDHGATRWTFSGPTAQKVMRFYRQLATGDRVAPREEEVPQLFQDTGFLTGKTAMCVNGPWFIPVLDKTDLSGDYAVAAIPRGPGGRVTQITWDGLVLRKNLPADRRTLANAFVQWALSREVQERLARLGRALPARIDALDEFVKPDPPRRQPFVDALAYSRVQPPLPKFESIDRAITRHFDEAVDPSRAFEAMTMLDALARDPAIVSAFPAPRASPP